MTAKTPFSGKEKVAFVAHPTDAAIFRSYISALRPDKTYSDSLLLKLFEWTKPYTVKTFTGLGFNDGHTVDASFYMVPFLPEMKEISVKNIIDKIGMALELAVADGCTVAAMGGFTSIVLQNMEKEFAEKYGIRITSGNAFTSAIIVRSIDELAIRFGIDLSTVTMAIIGASGDIGSACSRYFSEKVRKVILSARSLPALADIAEKIRSSSMAEVEIESDSRAAIREADVCIVVTSASTSLFNERDFRPGTIVCDASAPVNVRIESSLRDDVFIYHGGIAGIPFPIDTSFDIGLPSPYTFYGCQLEGLLLGLDGDLPCSWGRGNITSDKLGLFLGMVDRYRGLHPVYTIGNVWYNEKQLESYSLRWKDDFVHDGEAG